MDLWTVITSIPGIGPAVPYLTALIAVCAALATALPPPASKGSAYWWFYSAVNYIALNLGHAKNAQASAHTDNGDSEHA